MSEDSPRAALRRAPWRFGFDAAVRVLTRGADPAERLRFRSGPGTAFPGADVVAVDPPVAMPAPTGGAPTAGDTTSARPAAPTDITVQVMGLTGPSGVLPRAYSEAVMLSLRARSRGLHAFLDLLAHRCIAFFARAGTKYRPARAAEASLASGRPDPIADVLLALTGYATPNLVPRLLAGTDPLLHYAGLFAMRPRSADRLGALVSDWLGRPVEVIEFAGAWLSLPPDQRTRMPRGTLAGAWNRLGVDAAAGIRAWDPQARIILRIGPLDRAGFAQLQPDRRALHRLVSLVRAYLGFETGFAVNLVLATDQISPLRLDAAADPPPQLGWNCWLPRAAGGLSGQADAAQAVFDAEVIEAQQARA